MDAISLVDLPLPASVLIGAIAAMVYLIGSARHRQGTFSMVDAMIVVATMGIVSGVAAPLLQRAEDSAKHTVLQQNLRTLQRQIELYKMDHGGNPPVLFRGGFPQLIHATDGRGIPGPPGESHPYGPYLPGGVPPNPYTGIRTVEATEEFPPAGGTGKGGWLYHEASGRIAPDLPPELVEANRGTYAPAAAD